jgi:hypothetical protein
MIIIIIMITTTTAAATTIIIIIIMTKSIQFWSLTEQARKILSVKRGARKGPRPVVVAGA